MKFTDKLKSRKFIAALIGMITGVALIFGVDEGIIGTVSGAVVSIASVMTYITAEGKIDLEAIPVAGTEGITAETAGENDI